MNTRSDVVIRLAEKVFCLCITPSTAIMNDPVELPIVRRQVPLNSRDSTRAIPRVDRIRARPEKLKCHRLVRSQIQR